MEVPDLVGLFLRPLESIGIPYMVTGGVASVIYGEPRFTRDIDIVLELEDARVEALAEAFEGGDFYVPPIETLREEARRRAHGHFNVIHRDTALRADVYLRGDDPLHAWAFERRRRIPLADHAIWLAPIEYVVIRKLEYYDASGSERHMSDIARMNRISGDQIDRVELNAWLERLGLGEHWEIAKAHVD